MADKKYVVMKWKDGWQEVVAVQGDVIDFSKYYVVERLEQYGRLVLNRPKGEVPELVVIGRNPRQIEKVTLVDADQRTLTPKDTYREGTRMEYNYDLAKDGDVVAELAAKVKEVLAGRRTSARDLLSKGDADILAIAKEIQVVGTESQADLVNFMKLLLARL
ncbi:MAG TPA: hypothetical protein VMT71_17115 [Syntrophorhabdales bacterium]|nr:hypothetical protein [Syntrophorhabdales bacterium]